MHVFSFDHPTLKLTPEVNGWVAESDITRLVIFVEFIIIFGENDFLALNWLKQQSIIFLVILNFTFS